MSEPIRRRSTTAAIVLDEWEQLAIEQIRDFRKRGAFGSIRVQVEHGRIVRVLVERSIKSPDESTG